MDDEAIVAAKGGCRPLDSSGSSALLTEILPLVKSVSSGKCICHVLWGCCFRLILGAVCVRFMRAGCWFGKSYAGFGEPDAIHPRPSCTLRRMASALHPLRVVVSNKASMLGGNADGLMIREKGRGIVRGGRVDN
jgi:hypothetical protein